MHGQQNIKKIYIYKISCIIRTGYIWLHVSAVTRPSSGQQGIVLLGYIQLITIFSRNLNFYFFAQFINVKFYVRVATLIIDDKFYICSS